MMSDGAEEHLRDPTQEIATQLLAANEQLVVAALRSEMRFRAYFDVSPEYLYLLRLTADDRLVFEEVNPAGAELYGLSREQIIGRTAADIDSEDGAESVDRHGRLALRSGRPVSYEVNRPIGSRARCTLNVIAAPMENSDDGRLVLMCGRDLTDQRQAEEALRQSQKMEAIGQLTGGIAHDFNNLLAAIMGSLELMQSRIARGRVYELHRYIEAAQAASKRAAALTHRLLAFSRRQTLSPALTDLRTLVRSMEDLIRRTIGPQIELCVAATGELWMTQVDQNQLENALLNLCINARDAMPGGGGLTVETANFVVEEWMGHEGDMVPGEYVSLSVSDTGTGMTAEVKSRAFDPFFTTKPLGSGTGLGLSMIYGFAKQSGGHARIYSEFGRGAMVCLYFPRCVSAGEPVHASIDPVAAPQATPGKTVLVVDDEELVRMIVIDVLEDLGYLSLEAVDAASGLKILQSAAGIDLLVTDVGLPGGMNGRQLADAARALRPELKVLFITGYEENVVINQGRLDGGMQIMTKPFAMGALGTKIRDMIQT
jgi:PAS domain S-box-containing protein